MLSPEDYSRTSDVINFRQRHDGGNAQIEYMIDLHFKLPPVTAADGNMTVQRKLFDDYLYLTQVRAAGQMGGLRERRRRSYGSCGWIVCGGACMEC